MAKEFDHIEVSTLFCYPVKKRTKDGWENLNELVELADGKVGVRTGREVIQVVVNLDGKQWTRWIDPITGEFLQQTQKKDGLWSPEEQVWRKPYDKEIWEG